MGVMLIIFLAGSTVQVQRMVKGGSMRLALSLDAIADAWTSEDL